MVYKIDVFQSDDNYDSFGFPVAYKKLSTSGKHFLDKV